MRLTRVATGTAGARGPRLAAGIAAGLALIALAACGGDDSDSGDTDEPDTTEEAGTDAAPDDTTTTEPLSPEEEVLAAYEAAMDAVVAAYDPADPNHPDLLATHDGTALSRHQSFLGEYEGEGQSVVATTSERNPTVTRLAGDTATVEDCIYEILEYLDSETREPVREPSEDNVRVERQMERIDGTWKLVAGTTLEEDVC